MKHSLLGLAKKVALVAASLAIVVGVAKPALAAYGPDRPTKAWTSGIAGFDHVTFNSFTGVGNGIGDERDFFRGVQVGRDSVWSDPVNNVTSGAEVEGKIYIHNGADGALNDAQGNPGIAHNVTVRVALPNTTAASQDATAYISADNAQPKQIFDTLTMTGANNGQFALAYEAGTAQLHEQDGSTTTLTSAQEQQLVGSGLNLGDQKGCFQYVQEITFKMKVNMPRYTISKQVTTPGSTDWKETMNANPGDTVSWLITFKNTGDTELKGVKIVDEVPANLTVVPGSVKLVNGNYPNGYVYPDSAIQANGRQVNVDIGNYKPGILGYVTFRTKVADVQALDCGANNIVNKAFSTPEGFGAIWDTASVTVNKTCTNTPPKTPPQTPKTLVNTGPGDVIGIFGGTSLAGALLHRKWSLRRTKR